MSMRKTGIAFGPGAWKLPLADISASSSLGYGHLFSLLQCCTSRLLRSSLVRQRVVSIRSRIIPLRWELFVFDGSHTLCRTLTLLVSVAFCRSLWARRVTLFLSSRCPIRTGRRVGFWARRV